MTERERTIEFLVEEAGTTREGAELRLVDDDLWLVPPVGRREFPICEDTVEAWRDAVTALEGLYSASITLGNEALMHALSDAHERAIEALRRARQRAQEASAQ